jgi:hypothetical protein
VKVVDWPANLTRIVELHKVWGEEISKFRWWSQMNNNKSHVRRGQVAERVREFWIVKVGGNKNEIRIAKMFVEEKLKSFDRGEGLVVVHRFSIN